MWLVVTNMKLAPPKESLFLSTLIGRSAGWYANIFVVSPCYCFQGDSFFTLTGSCRIFVRSEMFISIEYWGCNLTVSVLSWICSLSCVLSGKHFWKWDGFRWWSKDTVAVVTGANKGIGLEIVRQLAKEGITVVLTARDETRGKEALESLKRQELHNVNFHPLDVASQESIRKLAEWLHKTYGGIDILVSKFKSYKLLKHFAFVLC